MVFDKIVLEEITRLEKEIETLKKTNKEFVLVREYLEESSRDDEVWFCNNGPRIELAPNSIDMEGFKKCLVFFHKKGYHIRDTYVGDSIYSKHKVWCLEKKGCGSISLALKFRDSQESRMCKMAKTGEKKVPIYEVVCE